MIANKKCQSYEQANQHKQINHLKGNINAEKSNESSQQTSILTTIKLLIAKDNHQ